MSYLRVFASAIEPADRDEVLRLFHEDVEPVFLQLPGCSSIELALTVEQSAGGLLDGLAISRWGTLEQMEEAVATQTARDSMERISALLRHAPSIRVLEILE